MSGTAKFERLLEPGYIGKVKTRNRLIKSGAQCGLNNETEPHLSEAAKNFYERLAKGGAGLIIVESPNIDYPLGGRTNKRLRIDDDKYIKELSELPRLIHKHGCPAFIQFYHDGPWDVDRAKWHPEARGAAPLFAGPPAAASQVSFRSVLDNHNEVPRVLTRSEVEDIGEKFINAAVRAQKAGFDGVDINAASSHMLHAFLSPFFNKRQDEYGGSLENRARLVTHIIREIKNRTGADFAVAVIFNGLEIGRLIGVNDSECLTPSEAPALGRLLQEAGADAIQVRSNWLGRHTASWLVEHFCYPEPPIPLESFPKEYDATHGGAGVNLRLAGIVKKGVSVPIITVGRLNPTLGEQALREGKADFIAMTRRLIADHYYPNKLAEGRLDDITPCTACCTCAGLPPKRCMVNAAWGKEYEYEVSGAKKKKKVLVAGGGPAGMEAARVAALRGHDVTLYEKDRRLGGLIPVAALVKGFEFEDFLGFGDYLAAQLKKLGVTMKLGKEVDASVVEKEKPDVVIVATGGTPTMPEIPGIGKPLVSNPSDLHQKLKSYLRFVGPKRLEYLTKLSLPVGKKVVIMGGGIHGCELAEFFAKRDRQVTLVSTGTEDQLGEGMVPFIRDQCLEWFAKKGVVTKTEARYVEVVDKGLIIINQEGKREIIEADTVVPAMPVQPNTDLLKSLEGKAAEVHAIGDCSKPQLLTEAVAAGSAIGRKI